MNLLRSIFCLRTLESLLNNIIAAILLLAMMLLVVSDVTGRYLFNKPVHGAMEITEFIMVAIVYFTLSHTQAIKAHIKVDLILERISQKMRHILELISYLLGVVIFALIAWQGVMSAIDAWEIWEVTDGLIPFPTLPAKLTIPIGCFIFCLRFLVDIVEVLKKLAGKHAA